VSWYLHIPFRPSFFIWLILNYGPINTLPLKSDFVLKGRSGGLGKKPSADYWRKLKYSEWTPLIGVMVRDEDADSPISR